MMKVILMLVFVAIVIMPATTKAIDPTAVATTTNVTTAGGTQYSFTVRYSDDGPLLDSFDNDDVRISGPGGFDVPAAFVSEMFNGATQAVVTYSIIPPGGSWDSADNGTYTVVMQPNQVFDQLGNPVAPGNIGSFNVAVGGSSPTPATLGNISTRLRVQSGDNALIGGLIATGTAGKKVIIRAIGPSLTPFGVTGALANPTLDLFQGSTLLFSNDDWQNSTQQADIAASGLAPSNAAESAIIWTLTPGQNYTAVVRGLNGTTGIGVVDAFDLDQAAASKLGNISTRGFVDVDDNVMIAGLIAGPSNGTSLKILARALGPTLSDFGVVGALANPTLDLVNSNGTVIRANNNWKDDPQQRALIEAAGLAPSHDEEAALVETVAPGAYTAVVRGSGRTTGVALVETYNIP
jgi:hypothetical protein